MVFTSLGVLHPSIQRGARLEGLETSRRGGLSGAVWPSLSPLRASLGCGLAKT